MPEEEAKQEEEVKQEGEVEQEPEAKAEEPEAKAEAEAPDAEAEAPEAKAEEPEAKAEEPEAKAEVEEPKPEAKKPEAKPEAKKPEPKAEAKKPAKPVKRSPAIEDIMTKIKKMTVLELAELVQALQDEFGVSAAVPVAAAPAAAAPGEAAADEEKTEFTVVLKEIGANKISVIRAVRELTTLGLKEAKDFVESAPQTVKEGVNKEEAATAKQKLEAAGATVEVK